MLSSRALLIISFSQATDEFEKLINHAINRTNDLQEHHRLKDKMSVGLKGNQKIISHTKKYTFVEWRTFETLYIKEKYQAKVTIQKNGDKLTEWKSTKYR